MNLDNTTYVRRDLADVLGGIFITFLRLSSRLSLRIKMRDGGETNRKIVAMLEKLPYSKLVEKAVLEMIRGAVPIRQIIVSIQHMTDAPKSLSTLYKHYGPAMEAERAKINGAIGSRVIDQALHGDPNDGVTFKSQELFLRSKGGWSPQNTTNEVEQTVDPEVDEAAADTLMGLLGFNKDDDEAL